MKVLDAVGHLYHARWGEPSRMATFRTGQFEIGIYKWDADSNDQGVDLYATLGASSEDMPGTEKGHRVEYFLGLKPGRDAVASPLAALGLFARREQETIDHGHTVPGDGPLWPGTAMRTFLVLRPRDEVLRALSLADGVHVEFLQAVPIFDSERAFNTTHGTEALLELWQSNSTPFWNPDRVPQPA